MQSKNKYLPLSLLMIVLLAAFIPGMAFSQSNDSLDLEDLLNTKINVASKAAEKTSDAPGIISVITKDEIRRFGGTTLADILNRVPGLINISNYFTDRSIMAAPGDSVRNTTTNRHVLVLFDGRPVREVQEGGIKTEVYESFPVIAIDHIEVIKGPGSVLYGSEAYSAVINVVTLKAEKNGATVDAAYGEGGAYTGSGMVTVKGKDFSLLAAARNAKKELWPVNYWVGVGPNDPSSQVQPHDFQDIAISTLLKGNYKNFAVTAYYDQYKNSVMQPDALTEPPLGANLPGDLRNQKLFLNGGYTFDFSSKWKMTADMTYNRSWFDMSTFTFPNNRRDSSEILAEVTNFVKVTDKANLTFGGLYSYVTGWEILKDFGVTIANGNRNGYAGYAQFDYKLADAVKAIGGFQVLKIGQSDTTAVPRLGLIWQSSKHTSVKVLYGKAFRAPYINEALADFAGLKGTPSVSPEMVSSYQAGVTYQGDRAQVGASYFRNHQTKIIGYVYLPEDPGRPTYQNVGEAKIQGVELEGKYYVTKEFFLSGSMLRQFSDDPIGIADLGGKAGISYSDKYATFSLFSIMQGSVPVDIYNPNSRNPKPGSYQLLYMHVNFDLNNIFKLAMKEKLSVYIQGDNLLDKEVWVPASGDPMPEVVPFKRGRTVYFGVRVGI